MQTSWFEARFLIPVYVQKLHAKATIAITGYAPGSESQFFLKSPIAVDWKRAEAIGLDLRMYFNFRKEF